MRSIFVRTVRYGALAALLPALAFLLPGVAAASNPANIQPGSSGYWVRVAQQDLTELGYSLPVTGYFGSNTTAKVNAFKRSRHLPANGQLAWPNGWRALRTAVSREQRIPEHYAHLNSSGLAVAPANAPIVVKRVIQAANHIAFKPYIYAGGHASWNAPGYDCSGSVSYALHGGGLLWAPEDSTHFRSYGVAGWGKWMRLYAISGHVYMKIAGLWFDTGDQNWGSYGHGDRWSTRRVSPTAGYVVRHPIGF